MTAARTPGSRRVTVTDVARHARVDPSIVSRVVNGDPRLKIRDDTRWRVEQAIEELQYKPNAAARSLRTSKTGVIGLLIPDFKNPVYAGIIQSAEREAASRGSLLLSGSLSDADGGGSLLERASLGRVDGLLLAGAGVTATTIRQLDEMNMPWLLVNRTVRGARRSIVLGDERAAALATEYLVGLGHRRIAHISGPRTADTAVRRRQGYEQVLRAAGLDVDDSLCVAADYSTRGGEGAMRELLAAKSRPTAVLVANAASAIGALAAARDAGVKVPDDISVVALHDLDLAGYTAPPLTTVRMPLDELGRRAVELLMTLPADEPVSVVLENPLELVVRGSAASPRGRRRSNV